MKGVESLCGTQQEQSAAPFDQWNCRSCAYIHTSRAARMCVCVCVFSAANVWAWKWVRVSTCRRKSSLHVPWDLVVGTAGSLRALRTAFMSMCCKWFQKVAAFSAKIPLLKSSEVLFQIARLWTSNISNRAKAQPVPFETRIELKARRDFTWSDWSDLKS